MHVWVRKVRKAGAAHSPAGFVVQAQAVIAVTRTRSWIRFHNLQLMVRLSLCSYAAVVDSCSDRQPYSGSYGFPLTHNLCRSTLSFLATATIALFFAFFPPRSLSLSPQRFKALSGAPFRSTHCAHCTRSDRK